MTNIDDMINAKQMDRPGFKKSEESEPFVRMADVRGVDINTPLASKGVKGGTGNRSAAEYRGAIMDAIKRFADENPGISMAEARDKLLPYLKENFVVGDSATNNSIWYRSFDDGTGPGEPKYFVNTATNLDTDENGAEVSNMGRGNTTTTSISPQDYEAYQEFLKVRDTPEYKMTVGGLAGATPENVQKRKENYARVKSEKQAAAADTTNKDEASLFD